MNNKEGEERLKLSIEETNALRAKLGLKPLRVNETKSPTISAPPPASAPADTIIDHEDTKGDGDDSYSSSNFQSETMNERKAVDRWPIWLILDWL